MVRIVTIKVIVILFIIFIFRDISLFADSIITTVGFKSKYTTGISEDTITYKPFGKLSYKTDFLTAEISGTYIINQQIADGTGNFTTINCGQGEIKAILYVGDIIDFGGRYTVSRGENSYNSSEYMINGSVYFGNLSFNIDYTYENKEYNYIIFISEKNQNFLGSIAYEINDGYEWELEYNFISIEFSNLDNEYYKHILRAGLLLYSNTMVFMAGVSGGNDSGDYNIFGFDITVSKKITDNVKLMVGYAVNYYQSPPIEKTTGGGHGGYSNAGYKNMNPYMRSDLIGKSFIEHALSGSVSVSF